jgi:hypothetical protein
MHEIDKMWKIEKNEVQSHTICKKLKYFLRETLTGENIARR